MEYGYTTANDGCKLAFQTSIPLNPTSSSSSSSSPVPDPRYKNLIILIHGFSGSSAYFSKNYASLSSDHWVVAPDLRGHGASGRPQGGYHVARLAADLRDLISHLRSSLVSGGVISAGDVSIVPVGCSIGAAILWTYVELFGDSEFAGLVFVDQAPLQDRSLFGGGDGWDATKAHRGCFDEASMLAAQQAWVHDSENAYCGLVADCLGYRVAPVGNEEVSPDRWKEDEEFFTSISRKCDPVWLARLLADHTRYDHREACEQIRVPVLVLAGRRTGCFPLEGMRETVLRVEKGWRDCGQEAQSMARWTVFESGHWLFWEEPERFSEEVLGFVGVCVKKE